MKKQKHCEKSVDPTNPVLNQILKVGQADKRVFSRETLASGTMSHHRGIYDEQRQLENLLASRLDNQAYNLDYKI